jgi:ankyrin repeat protein
MEKLLDAYGHPSRVKRLLEEGLDVNAVDERGHTALIEILDRGDDSKKQAESTALVLEKKSDLEIKNENGETALFMAVRMGLERHMKLLVAAGARVDVEDEEGLALLVSAVDDQTQESSVKAMKLLLKVKGIPAEMIARARTAAEAQGWKDVVALLDAY